MSHTDTVTARNYVRSLKDAIQTVISKGLFCITDDKSDHVIRSPPLIKGVYCMFCHLKKLFQKMQFILSFCGNDTPSSQS